MQMTVEEIIRSYTQAKDKSKQIGILAELNGCAKEKIRVILLSRGCQMPTKGRPKKETSTRKTSTTETTSTKKSTSTEKPMSTEEPTSTKKMLEALVKKDEFESPMRPIEATINGGIVEKVTFINKDTGEKITQVFDETKPNEEKPIEAKLFIPEVVKGLVIERISQIEFEITKLKLDKEELEDFLEQFADDV